MQTVRGLAAPKLAITRALDRLEDYDLTQRRKDPHDRRSIAVDRTPIGVAYIPASQDERRGGLTACDDLLLVLVVSRGAAAIRPLLDGAAAAFADRQREAKRQPGRSSVRRRRGLDLPTRPQRPVADAFGASCRRSHRALHQGRSGGLGSRHRLDHRALVAEREDARWRGRVAVVAEHHALNTSVRRRTPDGQRKAPRFAHQRAFRAGPPNFFWVVHGTFPIPMKRDDSPRRGAQAGSDSTYCLLRRRRSGGAVIARDVRLPPLPRCSKMRPHN